MSSEWFTPSFASFAPLAVNVFALAGQLKFSNRKDGKNAKATLRGVYEPNLKPNFPEKRYDDGHKAAQSHS
jgi:hypothetical protein